MTRKTYPSGPRGLLATSTLAENRSNLELAPEDAGAWTVTPMSGRVQARILLPDVSRRISVITEQELWLLRQVTGIEPG